MADALLKALAWLGSLGSRGVAAAIFVGIALPWLAAAFKPALTPAIIAMLTVAFLRVRPEAMAALRRAPGRVVSVTLVMMIATPLVAGLLMPLAGPLDPGLKLGVALQVAAPPTMTSAAFAVILGLDAAYGLALLLAAMAITPLTAPSAIAFITGEAVPIDVGYLSLRLTLILLGSVGAALVIRRIVGVERLHERRAVLDGLTMILLFVFAVAVMDGVALMLWERPGQLLLLLAIVVGVSQSMVWATFLMFRALGVDTALTAGLAAGHRNMGLLIAAWTTGLPDMTWAVFAMAQFPVYLAPIFLGWIGRRLGVGGTKR